jgi:hypothetical protein
MLQHTSILILYRNYRKSSEAHCGQHNDKVATENDIQWVFQLLHEPVRDREKYREFIDIYRIYYYVLLLYFKAVFRVHMSGNIES